LHAAAGRSRTPPRPAPPPRGPPACASGRPRSRRCAAAARPPRRRGFPRPPLPAHNVVPVLTWPANLRRTERPMHVRARPPAAALLGQLFLGERVTAAFFGAAAVVMAGVLLAQWRATDAAEEALLESPAKP